MLSEGLLQRVDEQDGIPVQRCNEVLVNQTAKSNGRTLDLCTSPTRGRGSKVDCGVARYPLIFRFVVEMGYGEKPIAQVLIPAGLVGLAVPPGGCRLSGSLQDFSHGSKSAKRRGTVRGGGHRSFTAVQCM